MRERDRPGFRRTQFEAKVSRGVACINTPLRFSDFNSDPSMLKVSSRTGAVHAMEMCCLNHAADSKTVEGGKLSVCSELGKASIFDVFLCDYVTL